MSSSGTLHTSAPNSSGYCVSMMPISRPPLLPPWAPSCSTVVMPRSHQIRCDRGEVLGDQVPALAHRLGVPARARTRRRRGCWPARRCRRGPARAGPARRRSPVSSTPRSRRSRRAASAPVRSLSRCPTTKYGIAVPSSDVAKCCVTLMSSASKNAGADLICSSGPSAGPCSSRDGVSNPLESRKISSPSSSVSTMTVLVLSGMPGTGSASQLPGVTISHPAGDVGEGDDDQPVPRPRVVVQAGVLVGLEDDLQIRLCRRGIRRSRRPAASPPDSCAGPDVPVGAQLDQQPVAVHRHGGVGGRVDADQLAAAQLVDLVVEEVDRPAEHRPLEARRAVHRRRDDHIGARPAEQRLGVGERRRRDATA